MLGKFTRWLFIVDLNSAPGLISLFLPMRKQNLRGAGGGGGGLVQGCYAGEWGLQGLCDPSLPCPPLNTSSLMPRAVAHAALTLEGHAPLQASEEAVES